ncbi:MAG TPA: methyl-accepting chemotaxis protein [Candidatus Thiothrix moscowensis]|uniref:methyl-accepting chemotaxis protein n=1 Tax=unclassified Thiothrix TaxID=2636184 RepID=UPI001A1D0D6B|nr:MULTISPECIES: methyl-accepting chemotaxis protein [unclassified Thiothrix]MBJ6611918.1 methyl-accepting chemotaxis protein [Candidatus Thiothrix moscowensis]HRJ54034.1 methyl-accepting chemotaxis protein [Candidatus Thiothrix moscowensis]HRJ94116.1 methyl-accepting chemotaxis protein [Candidatus Thiothrix moscowensis]
MSLFVWQLLAGLLLVAALILGGLLVRLQQQVRRQSAGDARQQQQAILRLLDEMSSLADGDLTMRATVTEDVTGAIADAVNYAVDALRALVIRMDSTSNRLTRFAQDADERVNQLADSSARQTQEIGVASSAIATMTQSIQKVSRNASSSAEVARKSLEIAQAGARTVRATIDDMGAIREQIQATSKRLKRLGESSQEVGDIVRLMNDIAEQTNILALNASIQTTASNAAGGNSGFRRLADEMQQLAQQAAGASRKIDVLIRTMQADTHEVMASMEETTAKVVDGARNAGAAGEALDEVENVTVGLARLIGNISDAAGKQADMAERVSGTMGKIQETTRQAAQYSQETRTLVTNLNATATDLRQSIAGFNLAEEKK